MNQLIYAMYIVGMLAWMLPVFGRPTAWAIANLIAGTVCATAMTMSAALDL